MLIRNSISNTKKFFQKTLKNFKSLFSGGDYQKLPKSPHNNQYSLAVSNEIIARTSFNDGRETQRSKKRNKERITTSSPTIRSERHDHNRSFTSFTKASPAKSYQIKRREESHSHSKELVTQKLREVEMMDLSNVDHVLDVEEVLHYYSRLTCPAYVDIVDKFFMEMYAEFIGSTSQRMNSRQMVYSVRCNA